MTVWQECWNTATRKYGPRSDYWHTTGHFYIFFIVSVQFCCPATADHTSHTMSTTLVLSTLIVHKVIYAKHNLRFEVIQNKVYIGSPATEEMLLECTQNFDTFWPFQNLCYPLNKYNIARVWIMVLHDVCIVIFMLPLNEPYTMNPSYISRTSLLLGGCL